MQTRPPIHAREDRRKKMFPKAPIPILRRRPSTKRAKPRMRSLRPRLNKLETSYFLTAVAVITEAS